MRGHDDGGQRDTVPLTVGLVVLGSLVVLGILVVLGSLVALWVRVPALYGATVDGRAEAVATTRTGIGIVAAALIAFTSAMLSLAETRRAGAQARERDRQTRERELAGQLIERYMLAVAL